VDLSRVGFAIDGTQHVAALEVVVFCDDPKWQKSLDELSKAQM
jgi:hypothetical protein